VSTTRRMLSSVEDGVGVGDPSPPHPPAASAIAAPSGSRPLILLDYDNRGSD